MDQSWDIFPSFTNSETSQFYCEFGDVQYNGIEQKEQHFSRRNVDRVNTDQDRSWQYRQSPWRQTTSEGSDAAGSPNSTGSISHKIQKFPSFTHSEASQFYCDFCDVQCNGINQKEKHVASRGHVNRVNIDQGRSWQYRQPPWQEKTYRLCQQ